MVQIAERTASNVSRCPEPQVLPQGFPQLLWKMTDPFDTGPGAMMRHAGQRADDRIRALGDVA